LSALTGLFASQDSDFATSLHPEAELSSFPPSTLPIDMNQDQILVNKSSLLPVTNLTALPDWNLQTARQGPVLMATGDMVFTFEAVSSSTNPADRLSETMPSFIHSGAEIVQLTTEDIHQIVNSTSVNVPAAKLDLPSVEHPASGSIDDMQLLLCRLNVHRTCSRQLSPSMLT
jgi:hypothetical protein